MTVRMTPIGSFLSPAMRDRPVDRSATYPMLGVRSFGRGAFAAALLDGDATSYSMLHQVKEGDVVYPKLMAWEGAYALVSAELSGRWVSPEFCVFEVDETEADPRYVSHLISWEGFRDGLLPRSSGTNARRRRLQPSAFLDHQVPLPILPEQRRIANHLSAFCQKSNSTESFGVGIWTPIESAISQLPWDTPLKNLMREDADEVEINPTEEYRQLGVFGKGRGLIDRGTFRGSETKYTKMLRVRAGQVVMSRLKAFEGAVAVAFEEHAGALVSREFPTFTLSEDVDPQFVRGILRSAAFEEQLREKSIGLGARRERVDAQRFLSITVPCPPMGMQRSLGRTVERTVRIDALRQRSRLVGSALLPAARNEVFSSLR